MGFALFNFPTGVIWKNVEIIFACVLELNQKKEFMVLLTVDASYRVFLYGVFFNFTDS